MSRSKNSAMSFVALLCSVCLAVSMLFTGEASAQPAYYEVRSEGDCRFGELFVPYQEAQQMGLRGGGRYPDGGFCVPYDYKAECERGGWAHGIGIITGALSVQWAIFAGYAGAFQVYPVAAGAGLISGIFGVTSFALSLHCG